MTIYTIIEAPHTLPHESGSPQAVACEVASTWLGIDIPLEHLRAIENDSKYKTFAALNESELCTVFVDQERADVWGRGLQSVAGSIQEHQYAVWEIERGLLLLMIRRSGRLRGSYSRRAALAWKISLTRIWGV
ncbi:MAG: hypothetical protein EBT56_15955 [Betaproteobacteria bacterium]|nr:hypothetical protein [Betaproteobacteria bacterium]